MTLPGRRNCSIFEGWVANVPINVSAGVNDCGLVHPYDMPAEAE